MKNLYQNIFLCLIFFMLTSAYATDNKPVSEGSESQTVKRLVPKEGQDINDLLLEISNLPSAQVGEPLADVKAKILNNGGRIIQETDNQLVARGVQENGTEVKFDAYYLFEDGRFTGHPQKFTGTRISPSYQQRFFNHLKELCGSQFQGYSSYPNDPEHDFYGKLLVADIETCTEDEIRIPFTVGEDTSRTWIITKNPNSLTLKHDHRHQDGTPDEITNYGGTTTAYGSEFSQAFPADAFTAELIPAAATNEWTITLSKDGQSLIYFLARDGRARFKATLQKQEH